MGRKPEAYPCTEEHEPRMRLGDLGEPAQEGKARHHRQDRHVNAAGAGGKWSFLSGEVCLGAGCAVMAAVGGLHRKVRADQAEVSRGRSTGQGSDDGREGPNVE